MTLKEVKASEAMVNGHCFCCGCAKRRHGWECARCAARVARAVRAAVRLWTKRAA